jgi:hypothetical protein
MIPTTAEAFLLQATPLWKILLVNVFLPEPCPDPCAAKTPDHKSETEAADGST